MRRSKYAKLTDRDVETIRRRALEQNAKSAEIAAEYDIDPAYVRRIVRGEVRCRAPGPTAARADRQPPRRWAGNAFRTLLDGLPADIDRYGPFEMVFPHEPEPWRRALLETLGVQVVVEPGAAVEVRRPSRRRLAEDELRARAERARAKMRRRDERLAESAAAAARRRGL